jgi:hypothetical protein
VILKGFKPLKGKGTSKVPILYDQDTVMSGASDGIVDEPVFLDDPRWPELQAAITNGVVSEPRDQRLNAIYAEAERLDRTVAWTQEVFDQLFAELKTLCPGEDLEPFLVLVPAEFTDAWFKKHFRVEEP